MGQPEDRQLPRQIRMTDAAHAAVILDAAAAGFTRPDGKGDMSAYVRHLIATARKRTVKRGAW